MSTEDHTQDAPGGEIVAAVPAERQQALNQQLVQVQQNPMQIGQLLVDSGFFKDAQSAAQAAVKIMAGAELGFAPIASMTNVHIITTGEGTQNEKTTVHIGGALLAARIQGSDRYKFRRKTFTNEQCELVFYEKNPATGEWQEIGDISWTLADAQRAGLANRGMWRNYPRKMLFWRSVSDGADLYCSDLFGGMQVLATEVATDVDAPAALPAGGGGTTGHVGLPPTPAASPAGQPAAAPSGGSGQRQAPQASGQRQQSTEATITANQRKKLWAMSKSAGIHEDEQRLRLLIFWTTGVEHSDRIPRSKVDEIFAAVERHQAVVDEIIAAAGEGDDRARTALQTFKPDLLPDLPDEPADADVVDEQVERIAAESFGVAGDGDDAQGTLA